MGGGLGGRLANFGAHWLSCPTGMLVITFTICSPNKTILLHETYGD